MNLEELSKLWSVSSRRRTRCRSRYQASVVLIEPDLETITPLPGPRAGHRRRPAPAAVHRATSRRPTKPDADHRHDRDRLRGGTSSATSPASAGARAIDRSLAAERAPNPARSRRVPIADLARARPRSRPSIGRCSGSRRPSTAAWSRTSPRSSSIPSSARRRTVAAGTADHGDDGRDGRPRPVRLPRRHRPARPGLVPDAFPAEARTADGTALEFASDDVAAGNHAVQVNIDGAESRLDPRTTPARSPPRVVTAVTAVDADAWTAANKARSRPRSPRPRASRRTSRGRIDDASRTAASPDARPRSLARLDRPLGPVGAAFGLSCVRARRPGAVRRRRARRGRRASCVRGPRATRRAVTRPSAWRWRRCPTPHWSALAPAAPLRRWRLVELARRPLVTASALRSTSACCTTSPASKYLDERLAGWWSCVPAAGPTLPRRTQRLAGRIWPHVAQRRRRAAAGRRAVRADDPRRLRRSPPRRAPLGCARVDPGRAPAGRASRARRARAAVGARGRAADCALLLELRRRRRRPTQPRRGASSSDEASAPLLIARVRDRWRRRRRPAHASTSAADAAEQRALWTSARGPPHSTAQRRRLVGQFDLGAAAIARDRHGASPPARATLRQRRSWEPAAPRRGPGSTTSPSGSSPGRLGRPGAAGRRSARRLREHRGARPPPGDGVRRAGASARRARRGLGHHRAVRGRERHRQDAWPPRCSPTSSSSTCTAST